MNLKGFISMNAIHEQDKQASSSARTRPSFLATIDKSREIINGMIKEMTKKVAKDITNQIKIEMKK